MKTKRSLLLALLILLIFASLASQVSAQKITGSIGNSRMILRLEEGESVRKSVLVRNVNDISLKVDVTASGDLAESIELEETSFELAAGEEKKVYFTIKATKGGTTESKINIRFTPEEGNGIGLSSTVIVIAPGESETAVDSEDETADSTAEDDSGFSFNPSSTSVPNSSAQKINFSPLTILIISSGVLSVLFIILMIYAFKKLKKRPGRLRE